MILAGRHKAIFVNALHARFFQFFGDFRRQAEGVGQRV